MGVRKTIDRNCDHCGNLYAARVDSLERGMGKYCGRDCHFAVRRSVRVKMTCQGCGVEFEVIPAILKNDRGGKYCSDACCREHRYVKIPLEDRFWEKVDVRGPDECWEWTAARSDRGYGRIDDQQATHVAYSLKVGPIPEGMWVLHRCDNPPCCNPSHLFLGDNAINTQDKVDKGRQRRGETAPLSKLKDDQIREMRRLREQGETVKSIAAKFGIHYQTVYKIVTYSRWKHVI